MTQCCVRGQSNCDPRRVPASFLNETHDDVQGITKPKKASLNGTVYCRVNEPQSKTHLLGNRIALLRTRSDFRRWSRMHLQNQHQVVNTDRKARVNARFVTQFGTCKQSGLQL